jgi:hypothetical protein
MHIWKRSSAAANCAAVIIQPGAVGFNSEGPMAGQKSCLAFLQQASASFSGTGLHHFVS